MQSNSRAVVDYLGTVDRPIKEVKGLAHAPYSPEEFDGLVERVFTQCKDTLGVKRGEYSFGEDRLDNFHRQGVMQGEPPVTIGLTLLCKHITGICMALMELPVDKEKWVWRAADGSEGLQQRFVDAINYLLLLYALVDESVGEVPDE